MKPPAVFGLVLVAVLATVAIEESRIASLRARLEQAEPVKSAAAVPGPAASPAASAPEPSRPTRAGERPAAPASGAKAAEGDEPGDFARTVRKMWDNPAGKSMMNQGVKMAVAMMYGDFIDGLGLSKEEADYFRELLGKDMTDQQEIGMKMMGASQEERMELASEIAKRAKENEEAVKTFLNSEEDYNKFQAFKDQLPERQQLDGIRTHLASQQAPLDPAAEEKLVEAMQRARKQANATNFSGPEGFEELAKGDAVARFEQDWARQQEIVKKEVGSVLDEKQMKAFFEYQEQMKEFQLMGLKMISGQKEEAGE